MMTSRKVVEYVTAELFRPFRMRMASGPSFDIRHRDDPGWTELRDGLYGGR